jgi:nucleotide-binding universal stress UspA family protein
MNILAAVDFSDATQKMLHEVKRLASGLTSKVWLLHVVAMKPGFINHVDHGSGFGGLEPCFVDYGPDPKTKRDQISCQFKKEHKALQQEAGRLQRSGIETTALLIQGSVIEVIIHESNKLGIEMIIVGSHGHGAVYNLVIGSVSEGLLKRSPCPVLVIPTHDRA